MIDERYSVIKIEGEIDKKMVKLFEKGANHLLKKSKLLNILINSRGTKCSDHALWLGEFVWEISRDKNYYIDGIAICASSGAFTVLQACQIRSGFPKSHLLFHGFQFASSPNFSKLPDKKKKIDFASEQSMFEFIAWRSDKTVEEVKRFAAKDTPMTGLEAHKLGYLDILLKKPPPWLAKGFFFYFFIYVEVRLPHISTN